MADSWNINKWKEDFITPKRAIQNFFLHAIPVDSPNPDELVQLFPGSTSESHEDGTPVAGSSQSSQLSNLKQKREKSQQLEGDVSKKNFLDETEIFPDSLFEKSEVPPQLGSPSIVIPLRRSIKNKKQMSTRSFTEYLQSQQYQKIKETSSIVDCLDESSIASGIGSPNEPIYQQPERPKARVSTSDYTTSLAENNDVQEFFSHSSSQEVYEETPPSDYESGEKRDDPATPGFSSESNRSSTKSGKTAMSPINRYPALKNSTIVAGGASFLSSPLSMSPIQLSEKETPLTVTLTPTTPKLTRKPKRSVAQSPMFLNVMQKAISKTGLKADTKHSDASIHTSPSLPPLTPASSTPSSKIATSSTPTSSSVRKSKTLSSSKNVVGAKKSSLSNPAKGKSLALIPRIPTRSLRKKTRSQKAKKIERNETP